TMRLNQFAPAANDCFPPFVKAGASGPYRTFNGTGVSEAPLIHSSHSCVVQHFTELLSPA
ncbi:MAG: hypothetical protein OTI35_14960, partial [Sulfitobacter sp.]|nr:hypothetical protein [Sulfitobacter sp.]